MSRLEKLKQDMLDAVNSICESYRLEQDGSVTEVAKEVYEYPIYKVSRHSKQIVKFTGLTKGETLVSGTSSNSVGYKSSLFAEHTDKDTWLELPYDKDTGFYDMQIVACRDGFYDREMHRIYDFDVGTEYDIIEPAKHPSEFMLEQQRLAIERFIDENM